MKLVHFGGLFPFLPMSSKIVWLVLQMQCILGFYKIGKLLIFNALEAVVRAAVTEKLL